MFIIFFLILILTPCSFYGNTFTKEQVSYPSLDGYLLKSTLWLPQTDAPFPAIVYFHGGEGDQNLPEEVQKLKDEKKKKKNIDKYKKEENTKWFINSLLQNGYATLIAGYRWDCIGGEKEISDAIAAVHFLKTLHKIDAKRIVVMGGSHGGFLTMHILAKGEEVAAGVNVDGPMNPVDSFKLLSQAFGTKDLGKRMSQLADAYVAAGFVSARHYIEYQKNCYGENFERTEKIQKVNDALYNNIKNFKSPILIVCGAVSPFRNFVLPSAEKIVELAKKERKDVSMIVVPEMRHGLTKKGFEYVIEFLKKHLKG